MSSSPRQPSKSSTRKANAKGVPFSQNPVLATKLSAWRSRLVMFVLFMCFVALVCRAFWLQAMSTEFLQKQGESRYARTLELPATRGKITDRSGLVLASSIPVKAIWAIPEDVLAEPKDKIRQLAVLLEMSEADLRKKLDSDRQFVYLKRQVEQTTADKIVALNISGVETRKEYKPQEVVDALAKQGITTTANYVSNLKATHNKRQRSVRKVVAKGGVGIPELKAALALVKLTGSVAAAKQALAVAQEIKEIV